MRFGSKGLDAPVIIGIILAVIIAVVIFYMLWTRGMLPFGGAADRNTCLSQLLDACSVGIITPASGAVGGGGKVNAACSTISDINSKCGSCLSGAGCSATGTQVSNFQTCCSWVQEQAVG